MSEITLDPTDPFEAALVHMVEINRKKRNDYTLDPKNDPFWNFQQTADQVGTTRRMVVEMEIAKKQARLRALLTSGREPQNEAIEDTILDRAVYSVIAYAMVLEDQTSGPVVDASLASVTVCPQGRDHTLDTPHTPACYVAANRSAA